MISIDVKQLLGDKFHSTEVDTDEFKRIIYEFVEEAHPGDKVKSFEILDSGMIEIILESGEEIELEIDWNEFILR